MPSLCVFGAQWGDEGKGKIIDRLSADVDFVVRYQGGANAGHTVVVGDEKYVLHLVPSGILHPGKVNLIGPGVAVDPLTLLGEIEGLRSRGVSVDPSNLHLSAGAHVIFEHHKRIDSLSERWLGEGRIGTTGRGIGPCYADKAARTGVRVCDLIDPERLALRLRPALAEKNALLERVHEAEAFDVEVEIERYAAAGAALAGFVCDTGREVRSAYREGKTILFEGAQGMLLDIDAGTYPFVTSSNTGVAGVPAGAGVAPNQIDRVIGIAKAYCTRVGEGPFPSELSGADAEWLRSAGNEFGATTGRPRRCGWFDAVAARYTLELSGADTWVMTNLDVLSGREVVPVAVRYRRGDERWTEYPASAATLDGMEVEYDELAGWQEDITGVRSWDDLPATTRAYVEGVEERVGVPIGMLSVGPDRDQVIPRSARRPALNLVGGL